jgi:hypothetical protein
VGDKVEAAYRRGDGFQKRLLLAEEWAKYCGGVKAAPSAPEGVANVVVLPQAP